MTFSGFRKAGHAPTLLAAFLYFDVSFMAWVILGPLGPFIGEALKLTATQKGLLVAVPLLAGSFFRPILGVLGDRIGGRNAGLAGLALTLLPLLLGWRFASTLPHFFGVGFLLGIAGASFAVALPIAGRWYPPEYQGLVMGIAGAGNSGTLLATLFAPRLASAWGWHNAFAVAMIPIACVLVAFFLLARDNPAHAAAPSGRDYLRVLKEPDAAWLSFLYSMTFGGFVGLASFLTVYFHDQYQLSKIAAGDFTTVAVFAGSMLRPVGGFLSDRIGGYRLLLALLSGVAVLLAAIATTPAAPVALVLFTAVMALLGMGNGAVFQIMPQRFPNRLGIMTGIVGAAGGIGGFLLPSLLGAVKDHAGQFAPGFAFCAALALAAALVLLQLGVSWSHNWQGGAARRAGVFSWRANKRLADRAEDIAA